MILERGVQMDKVHYSINPTLINKDDYKGNHGYRWVNLETTGADLFEVLCVEGWAVAPQLKTDWRVLHQFSKTNLIMVDVDYGLSLDEALSHPFYKEYGYGYYLTSTHTDQAHRFRLIFITDEIITKPKTISNLRNALNDIFGGDKQCKDAVRLFYGNNKRLSFGRYAPFGFNGNLLDNNAGAVLLELADKLQERIATQSSAQSTIRTTYNCQPSSFKATYILDKLKKVDLSEYEIWFKVACGMKSAGLALSDFLQVSDCSERECKKTWDSIGAYAGNKITAGTLWYMIGGIDNYNQWRIST